MKCEILTIDTAKKIADYDKLKKRIDKAIEYINNNWDGSSYVEELNINSLLDILEGKL